MSMCYLNRSRLLLLSKRSLMSITFNGQPLVYVVMKTPFFIHPHTFITFIESVP